MKLRARAN